MGAFLKEELNAKGTLTEDKRHIFLLLLLEPLQAWWGCSFGWRWRLQRWCCLGAGKEPRGSALPAEGALFSSVAFSWGDCWPKERTGRTGPGAVKADEQFSSWVSCWLTTAGIFKRFCWGLAVCWASVIESTHSHCYRFGWADFVGVSAQGKAESQGGWENVLGKHLCFLCLPWRVCWLKWADRKILGYICLACWGYFCVFLCRQGHTKRTERLVKGQTSFAFTLSKSTAKPPPTDFSSHTCFLTRHLMVVYLIC